MEQNQQQNQGENNKKVEVNFEKNIKKLTAIVGGVKNLRPKTSIKKDVLGSLVQELFKEETEAIEVQTKAELKDLLKKYVEVNRAVDAKKKGLAQLEVQKKKEFNESATKLFAKISEIDIFEKDYYNALGQAAETGDDDHKEVVAE